MTNNFFEKMSPNEQKLFLEGLIDSLHPETSAWLSARLMIGNQKIVSFPDLPDLDLELPDLDLSAYDAEFRAWARGIAEFTWEDEND